MGNIATDINGVITTDGARSRLQRVGSTKDGTSLLDNILTFPDGSENRSRTHVVQETREERLLLKISVVFTEKFFRGLSKLDGNKLEATLLESGNDRSNESTLDTVRLFKERCC